MNIYTEKVTSNWYSFRFTQRLSLSSVEVDDMVRSSQVASRHGVRLDMRLCD